MQLTERQLELINEAGKAYAACYLLMTVAMDYADAGDEACKDSEESGKHYAEIVDYVNRCVLGQGQAE